jgi:hypothetical protein
MVHWSMMLSPLVYDAILLRARNPFPCRWTGNGGIRKLYAMTSLTLLPLLRIRLRGSNTGYKGYSYIRWSVSY